MTKAYKCLTVDGRGLFSGFAWPLPDGGPGAWVESDVDACRSGIHACRAVDLPYWLAPTLYEIELDGPCETMATKIVAPRGRLTCRIEGWNETTIEEFSRICLARAHELVAAAPELQDWAPPPAIAHSEPARLAFIAARIAEQAGGLDAYLEERSRQSSWLVGRLALD